jgi:hypothetical protein
VVLRCTKKLLDLLGRTVSPTEQPSSGDDWYANLLRTDRRKCLLLVHVDTLFPVFRARVRPDDCARSAPSLFRLSRKNSARRPYRSTWLGQFMLRTLTSQGRQAVVCSGL